MITEIDKDGADAVVLGCTELGMIVDTRANVLPIMTAKFTPMPVWIGFSATHLDGNPWQAAADIADLPNEDEGQGRHCHRRCQPCICRQRSFCQNNQRRRR